MTNITTAVALKKELDTLRPISKADELRIMQKFRLDWNFHSNNLEGNSLTFGETKALILFGITAQGKPLKDHLEVTGHDEAIKWVEEVLKEDRPLTENFIRQLHELILKEDYQTDAITPDGEPTKKWVRVGKYKTEPNHVRTVTGEIFYFATPEETPAKMDDLMEWYRENKSEANPILLASEFHYQFIRIHPFDDGNGRTARILMNFILMQFGYPPVIIKTQDKTNYIAALRQADAGIREPFVEYITDNLIRSLEIMIKGAKGEDIEEPDGLDKELAILEKRIESFDKKIELDENTIVALFEKSVVPLFRKFIAFCKKFDKFYEKSRFSLHIDGNGSSDLGEQRSINSIRKKITRNTSRFAMYYEYRKIDRIGLEDFKHVSGISINKSDSNTFLFTTRTGSKIEKAYGEQLTEEEMDKLIRSEIKKHKEVIEQKIAEFQQAKDKK
jgi:Fic family protein